jgi:hypothetical protein
LFMNFFCCILAELNFVMIEHFKKKEKTEELQLNEVFDIVAAKNERDFVRKFFSERQIKTILEECGITLPDEEVEILFDDSLRIGKSTLFPDVLLKVGSQVFYLEVMSQKNGGRWDDDHHQQLILKKTALELIYDEVYTFAVAFKEFDYEYQELFTKLENCYALQLIFDVQKEYTVNVVGLEEKKKKYSKNVSVATTIAVDWMKYLSDAGLDPRQNENWPSYVTVGKTFNGTKQGIEFLFKNKNKIGIKLQGGLYRKEKFKWIVDSPEIVVNQMDQEFNLNFTAGSGVKDKTFEFDFEKDNYNEENIELLKKIYEKFRDVVKFDE